MEIDQTKFCQVLGQMRTGLGFNMEMETWHGESYSGKDSSPRKQEHYMYLLLSQSVFHKCQSCHNF